MSPNYDDVKHPILPRVLAVVIGMVLGTLIYGVWVIVKTVWEVL